MTHLKSEKKSQIWRVSNYTFFSSKILFAEGIGENNSPADDSSPNVSPSSMAPRSGLIQHPSGLQAGPQHRSFANLKCGSAQCHFGLQIAADDQRGTWKGCNPCDGGAKVLRKEGQMVSRCAIKSYFKTFSEKALAVVFIRFIVACGIHSTAQAWAHAFFISILLEFSVKHRRLTLSQLFVRVCFWQKLILF